MLTLSYHCVRAMLAIAQDKFTGCGSLFQAWMCVPRAITAPISYGFERWGRCYVEQAILMLCSSPSSFIPVTVLAKLLLDCATSSLFILSLLKPVKLRGSTDVLVINSFCCVDHRRHWRLLKQCSHDGCPCRLWWSPT
jgi:hypothetical protein